MVIAIQLDNGNALYYRLGQRKAGVQVVHDEPFLYPLDSMLDWNRLYGPQGFFQYQSVVPRAAALESTRAMLDAIAASGEGSFLAVLKTFAKREHAGLLSFPHEGVTLAIDFRNSREAFVIATAVSFVGNALWSFGARPTPGKAAWFFAINTIGLFLNMLIAWILERAHAHHLLIALTVLVVVPMFNFAGHRLFTFSRS